jgi:hypothetical protein
MGDRRFYEGSSGTACRSAPAVLRNREPIAEVLADWLPASGLVLEIASGTGEHATFFADRFPTLEWQPSDVHADALGSIAAWREAADLPNLRIPIIIDASEAGWPIVQAAAVLSINMVHISPWSSAIGLIDGAARLLRKEGPLILYGPWLQHGVAAAPSNLAFDADLKRRDPNWGLRLVEDFSTEAAKRGFDLVETRPMPANNLMLLLKQTREPR